MALSRPLLGGLLLLWSCASRMILAGLVSGLVVAEPRRLRTMLLYPLRDLLGFGYWIASYVSNQVRWRGQVYNLLQDGFMRHDSDPGEHEPEAILTA